MTYHRVGIVSASVPAILEGYGTTRLNVEEHKHLYQAEPAYLRFLVAADRCGALSVVYPLARGTAPLLVVPAGLAIPRERLSPLELAGVACVAPSA